MKIQCIDDQVFIRSVKSLAKRESIKFFMVGLKKPNAKTYYRITFNQESFFFDARIYTVEKIERKKGRLSEKITRYDENIELCDGKIEELILNHKQTVAEILEAEQKFMFYVVKCKTAKG